MSFHNEDMLENSNIPKGRGMIKWQPFTTMPEQYRNITKLMDDNNKIKKPIIDEQQLKINEVNLKNLLHENIIVRYLYEGYDISLECRLENIDISADLIIVSKEEQLIYINFSNIYTLEKNGLKIE